MFGIAIDEFLSCYRLMNHLPRSRSVTTTLAPSFAKSFAVAAPIPWPNFENNSNERLITEKKESFKTQKN